MVQICQHCSCIILKSGYCRNQKCIKGNKNGATPAQITKIVELVEELSVKVSEEVFKELTKDQASIKIDKLIKRKVAKELYGEEE